MRASWVLHINRLDSVGHCVWAIRVMCWTGTTSDIALFVWLSFGEDFLLCVYRLKLDQ